METGVSGLWSQKLSYRINNGWKKTNWEPAVLLKVVVEPGFISAKDELVAESPIPLSPFCNPTQTEKEEDSSGGSGGHNKTLQKGVIIIFNR